MHDTRSNSIILIIYKDTNISIHNTSIILNDYAETLPWVNALAAESRVFNFSCPNCPSVHAFVQLLN